MSSSRPLLVIYGRDKSAINFASVSFSEYNKYMIVIDDNVITEDHVMAEALYNNSFYSGFVFYNADTMKRVNIKGIGNFADIISRVNELVGSQPGTSTSSRQIILFNRYLDSNFQTHYLGEYSISSGVSVFQSFKPGNSDAFYVSPDAVRYLQGLYGGKFENDNDGIKHRLFDAARNGDVNAYTFNPNLYTYRLESSIEESNKQYFKTSPINYDTIIETRRLGKNISLFFSDHILLFWIFIVFFICLMLVIFLKMLGVIELVY